MYRAAREEVFHISFSRQGSYPLGRPQKINLLYLRCNPECKLHGLSNTIQMSFFITTRRLCLPVRSSCSSLERSLWAAFQTPLMQSPTFTTTIPFLESLFHWNEDELGCKILGRLRKRIANRKNGSPSRARDPRNFWSVLVSLWTMERLHGLLKLHLK
jgi:hypothetical protein